MSDLISRKMAIDAINTWPKYGVDERNRIVPWYEGLVPYVHLEDVVKAIVGLPSAQRDVPDTNVGDMIYRQAAINVLNIANLHPGIVSAMQSLIADLPSAQPEITEDDVKEYCRKRCLIVVTSDFYDEMMRRWPSAQPEWNNHTVACLLADLFDDTCACNYNGIDEWLPEKCEVIDSCPNPVGVACWEQFLKHRAERRTDEAN